MSDDIDLDEMDDDDLDSMLGGFDSDDSDSPDVSDNRKPEGFVGHRKKFVDGFSSGVMSSSALNSTLINKVLPSKISSPISDVVDVKDTVSSVYEDAVSAVLPKLRGVTKQLDRTVPKSGAFRNILDKAKGLLGEDDSSGSRSSGPTNEEKAVDIVSSILPSMQENNDVKDAINNEIARKSSLKEQVLLSDISVKVGRSLDFNYSVSNNYYRKSLELQYRHLFIAKESFEMNKSYYDLNQNQLSAIVKNTGLPDFVKLRNMEALKENFRATQVSAIQKTLFGQGTFAKKLTEGIKNKSKNLIGGLSSGLENFADQLEQNADAKEFGGGIDKANLAGEVAGGALLGKLGTKLGKMVNNNKFLSEKFSAINNINSDIPGYLNRVSNDPKSGFFAKTGASLLNYLAEKDKTDLQITNPSGDNQDEATIFDSRTKDSITQVIPGLLSRIFGEVRSLRTGDEPELLKFDFNKKTFSTSKMAMSNVNTVSGQQDKIISTFEEEGQKSGFKQTLNNLMQDIISANPDITNKEKSLVKDLLIKRNLSKNQGGIDSIKKDTSFKRLSDEDKKRVTDILQKSVTGKTKSESLDKKASFNNRLSKSRREIVNPKEIISNMIQNGDTEELLKLRVIKYESKTRNFIINEKMAVRYMAGGFKRNVSRTSDDGFVGPNEHVSDNGSVFDNNYGKRKESSLVGTVGVVPKNSSVNTDNYTKENKTSVFNKVRNAVIDKIGYNDVSRKEAIKLLKLTMNKGKEKGNLVKEKIEGLSKLNKTEIIDLLNEKTEELKETTESKFNTVRKSNTFKKAEEKLKTYGKKSKDSLNNLKEKVGPEETKEAIKEAIKEATEKDTEKTTNITSEVIEKTRESKGSTSDEYDTNKDNSVFINSLTSIDQKLDNLQIINENTEVTSAYLDAILSEVESLSIKRTKGNGKTKGRFRNFIKGKLGSIRNRRKKSSKKVKGKSRILGAGKSTLGFITNRIRSLAGLKNAGKKLLGNAKKIATAPLKMLKKLIPGKKAFGFISNLLGFGEGDGLLGKGLKAFGKLRTNFKKGVGLGNRILFGTRNRPIDLYIPGDKEPILRANLMRSGGYIDSESGKVIRKLRDIKSGVLNRHGEFIITASEISKGLVDKDGKKIKLGNNVSSGLVGRTLKLVGGTLKLGGRLAKRLLIRLGKKPFAKIKGLFGMKDPKEAAMETAISSRVTAESINTTNKWLEKIHKVVLSIAPKKKSFLDRDGDGLRDGGFRERLRRKNKKTKTKNKTTTKEKEKSSKFDIMGMLSKSLPLIAGLITSAVTSPVSSVVDSVTTAGKVALGALGLNKVKNVFTKKATEKAAKTAAKATAKQGVKKVATKGIIKGLGKSALKKVPFLGALAGLAFAADRVVDGDWVGAGGELLSGIAGAVGFGIPASMAIDAALAARDAGMLDEISPKDIADPNKEALKATEKSKSKFNMITDKATRIQAAKNRAGRINMLDIEGITDDVFNPSNDPMFKNRDNVVKKNALINKRKERESVSIMDEYIPNIDNTLLSIDDTLKKSLEIHRETLKLLSINADKQPNDNSNLNTRTPPRGEKEFNAPKVSMSRVNYR